MLALALPVAIFLLVAGPIQWWQHYQSWSHLSKDELIESANWYIANRAPGNDACIFAVECKDGRARLKLIKTLDEWDFEASKQAAWDRKFKDVCQGRTANFALEVEPTIRKVKRPKKDANGLFGHSTTIGSSRPELDLNLPPLARLSLSLV
ncbi:hypothetical protein [Novosphingobium beihaiensis]|uniref:Uncharacterized protein n=1 Tax=Novosphingobium beihaiensis TaxID=2930389 RepID=A0ABT0BP06_9SPHN|nr:hypothetical protein [Novosphingobium beihaiensis]MCJ2186774.1 hypothetical protein [Novosphingobium beihaiensis]